MARCAVRRRYAGDRPSPRAPVLAVYDGPFNCWLYFVLKSEDDGPDDGQKTDPVTRRKFECLPVAKSLYFYIFYYTLRVRSRDKNGVSDNCDGCSFTLFPFPNTGPGRGTGDRDTHAGTATPGQRNKIAGTDVIDE